MYKDIIYEESGKVATITLNRPDKFNALSDQMRQELREVAAHLKQSKEIQVVIFTGAGKAFCAGGDIHVMKANIDKYIPYEERLTTYRRDVVEMVQTIKSIPQLLIAKLNGPTFGAGCSIALLCDIRIAASHVKFGLPFGKRGLIPDWGASYYLPRVIGYANAIELAVTGKTFDTKKALAVNLIQHEVPTAELDAFVEGYVNEVLESSPFATRIVKRSMEDALNLSLETALEKEANYQALCYLSDDHREGVESFIEKRAPEFTGE